MLVMKPGFLFYIVKDNISTPNFLFFFLSILNIDALLRGQSYYGLQRTELYAVGDCGLRSCRTPMPLLPAANFVVRTETPIDI
jgi:hypothetical protein